jgi:excisionase family DNA binding protein
MKNTVAKKSAAQQTPKKLFRVVPDLTERWSLGRSKIYQLIDSGAIQSVKIGAARRVTLAAVEAFEASLVANGSI